MKSCIRLFLVTCIAAGNLYWAAGQSSELMPVITASYVGKDLRLILLEWGINYRIEFDFLPEQLDGIKVTARIKRLPLPDALEFILQGTGLTFRATQRKKIEIRRSDDFSKELNQVVLPPADAPPERFDFTLSGTVVDGNTGERLPFAEVSVSGTTNGTTTNVDGYFTLFDIPSDTAVIAVNYVGYQPQLFRLQPGMALDAMKVELLQVGQQLAEVLVVSSRKEQMLKASKGISTIGISPAQLTSIPSLGEKDIFRSLQLLPGVSGSNESSSGLFVRGGTPDQNLVLFDGFTVYHVDHLFGFFSAFNANAIKDVQLYKGGFEAKYGGRLSSVVEITGKDGNTSNFNVGGGISLLSYNAYTEMPFAKGKGSILLAGRRSFQSSFYNNIFDDFSGASTADDNGGNAPFRRQFGSTQPNSFFYDLNGKVTYRSGKNIFSLSYYGGQDNLDNSRLQNSEGIGGGFFNLDFNFSIDVIDQSEWGNQGTSLKWSRRWNDQLYSNALLSWSRYFSYRDRGVHSVIERDTSITEITNGNIEDNNLQDLSFKWDWEWQTSQAQQLQFGLFATHNDIRYDYIQNDTIAILQRDDQGLLSGGYLQSKSTINDRLILTPGLRATHFDLTQQIYFEPRLSIVYLPTDRFKLKLAGGRYYQFANRIIREDIAQGSRDFWILSDGDRVPVSRSDQLILGASYENDRYLFDVEGYFKSLDNITEYTTRFVSSGFGPQSSLAFEESFYQGTGLARGIEFLLQKKTGAFSGWISYTLGRVENQFDIFGEDPFPAVQDQLHELKIVSSYRLNNWTFGGTFVYATGKPYTAPVGAYELDLLDNSRVDLLTISQKNAVRLPDYHRMDLSLTYRFDYFLGGRADFGLSIYNVYGNRNVWYKEYDVVEGVIIETDVNLLSFTPSLFFSWQLK